jgi:hypothetical protein
MDENTNMPAPEVIETPEMPAEEMPSTDTPAETAPEAAPMEETA